jgi:hypothetical protein
VRASPRRSKTVQNGPKKNERFSFLKTPDHICFQLIKKTKKSADARFFGPFYTFLFFSKIGKIGKNRKNFQKIAFFLMLCAIFSNISALRNMLIFSQLML